MTVFDGFDDLSYFNRTNIIILIIIFIIFMYLTESIYQSIILSLSIMYIHYRYILDNNKLLTNPEYIKNYGNKIKNLDNIKLEPYQEELLNKTFPKSKFIHDYNNKTLKNFMYLNQEFYYYNKQNWIDMIASIDNMLSIYEDIVIDNSKAGILYNSMKDYKNNALFYLNGIKISCKDKKEVINKINLAVNNLEEILNKYLYDIYIKNELYIKQNGYNTETKLIQPMILEGYFK